MFEFECSLNNEDMLSVYTDEDTLVFDCEEHGYSTAICLDKDSVNSLIKALQNLEKEI